MKSSTGRAAANLPACSVTSPLFPVWNNLDTSLPKLTKMRTAASDRFPIYACLAALTSNLAGCAGQPVVSLPPSSTPPSVLRSYSLEELLVHHEGLRLKPYLDTSGKWTIGVGRNLSDSGISEEEAFYLLRSLAEIS